MRPKKKDLCSFKLEKDSFFRNSSILGEFGENVCFKDTANKI
jgi:hypothetical protein